MLDSPELGDFDIMEELGSGNRATVYLVNCKRGRLRNRQLALRKVVSPNSSEITRLSDSSALHLSLSHPSILSLFSTFSTPSAHFQLLELALGGSLSSHISGETLSENHLRYIVKGIADALLYLKNEGVVHRDIRPSNILLATDGRPKLSGFELATASPPSKISLDYFVEEAHHYVSPEIIAGRLHSFEADWWSLGCVVFAALSGRPPFRAASVDDTNARILRGYCEIPTGISIEARQLLSGLLEPNPKWRTPPSEILALPFFDGTAIPLTLTSPNTPEDLRSKHALFESRSKPSSSTITPPRLRLNRHPYAPNLTHVDDFRNTQKRAALRDELLTRRIVSDPLPSKYQRLRHHSLLSRTSPKTHSQDEEANRPVTSPYKTNLSNILPIGTTRPVPFSTSLLPAESHKTVHGQITVFPSRSLLVDFRESERRRGQKGTEVLLIDSRGLEVGVYAAPHLSAPCCITEPTKQFKIEDLPLTYWRQYNDAALLVERIKQRTPKLMLNLGFVQCTLMANSTPADIELLSGRPATRKSANPKQSIDNAQLRLRLSRQLGSLEIAKHVSGAQGEEWTKRILKTVKEDSSHICSADWESLDDDEKNAMEHLNRFWRLCVFLEEQERQVNGASKSQSPQRVEPRISLSSIIKSKAPTPPRPPSPSSASTRRLSGVYIPPRPLKFPALPPRRPSSFAKVSFASNGASIEPQHPSVTGKTHLATWCKEDDIEDVPPPLAETKYIPSVGWCIRQSSRVTQGGRYKIMFVDGAVLEIDVDEDWAEFTGQDGSTKRYNIRTGNMMRPIADRMKAFGEFVSMFEEQSTSR